MTISNRLEDYVVTDRGGIVENRYNVHAAVVDTDGNILYAVGDPLRITLARSAAKPAQALAIMETGGPDCCQFDDADIALMCASHSSEDRHIQRARDMLAKASCTEGDLRCGGHSALSEVVNRRWIRSGYEPTGICNNCSGKHAGMLAGAKALGVEAGYHLPTHPMQLRVKEVVEDLSGLQPDGVKWGIDGCNLPAPAMPLHILAKTYAFFADSTDRDDNVPRTATASRIFKSMVKYPELVGGEGRFCTDLMRAFDGYLIGKLGADGCYGIGIRRSSDTRRLGSDGAIGIAVKIEDGNIGILYSAVIEILEQLGIGPMEARQQLTKYHTQKILNTMKVVTGHVSHRFKVRRVKSG